MLYRRVSLALVAGALVVGLTPSGAAAAQEIEGQYIVVLKPQAGGESAKRKVRARGGKVQREFSRVLDGFTAELDAAALAEVRKDPAVDYVEPDRVITLDATQQNPTWGLDRIDQRALPLSRSYTYDTERGERHRVHHRHRDPARPRRLRRPRPVRLRRRRRRLGR